MVMVDGYESVGLEVVGDGLHDLHEEGASLDLPAFLLGDLADAGPAVLLGAQQVLQAVDVGSLVSSLLLSCLVALLVGCIDNSLPSSASFSHSTMSFWGQMS
jgi:hypothetical protein